MMNREMKEKALLVKVAGYEIGKGENERWYFKHPNDALRYCVWKTEAVAVNHAWNSLMRNQNG